MLAEIRDEEIPTKPLFTSKTVELGLWLRNYVFPHVLSLFYIVAEVYFVIRLILWFANEAVYVGRVWDGLSGFFRAYAVITLIVHALLNVLHICAGFLFIRLVLEGFMSLYDIMTTLYKSQIKFPSIRTRSQSKAVSKKHSRKHQEI